MQEENKSLGMLKNVQFGLEIFTVSSAAYITVDFEKLTLKATYFTLFPLWQK